MAKQGPYPNSDRELIRRVERSAGGRAGYKQLVRELGLGGGRERRLLLEQLARITARGELVKTADEQWGLPIADLEKTGRVGRKAGSFDGLRTGSSPAAQDDNSFSGRELRATRDR